MIFLWTKHYSFLLSIQWLHNFSHIPLGLPGAHASERNKQWPFLNTFYSCGKICLCISEHISSTWEDLFALTHCLLPEIPRNFRKIKFENLRKMPWLQQADRDCFLGMFELNWQWVAARFCVQILTINRLVSCFGQTGRTADHAHPGQRRIKMWYQDLLHHKKLLQICHIHCKRNNQCAWENGSVPLQFIDGWKLVDWSADILTTV